MIRLTARPCATRWLCERRARLRKHTLRLGARSDSSPQLARFPAAGPVEATTGSGSLGLTARNDGRRLLPPSIANDDCHAGLHRWAAEAISPPSLLAAEGGAAADAGMLAVGGPSMAEPSLWRRYLEHPDHELRRMKNCRSLPGLAAQIGRVQEDVRAPVAGIGLQRRVETSQSDQQGLALGLQEAAREAAGVMSGFLR